MCPLCIMGSVFLAQLVAMSHWFRRVILRQPVPDEGEYWKPKSVLQTKLKTLAANPLKLTLICLTGAAEVIACVIIYRMGGFMFLGRLWEMLQ